MSPCTPASSYRLRLPAILITLTFAGCSLNPFADDGETATPVPVYTGSQAAGESTSMNQGTTQAAPGYREPVLQKVSDPVPLASGAPNEYVVKVGDTLWDIAATFLRDPWYWPEIWYVNPDIENPHLIYPGDVLGLVYIDGQPRITNIRAGTYRLSPQARVTPLTDAVVSVPYEAIASFLSTGVVLERSQIDNMPYMVASRGDHLIAAAGNQIYVRGSGIGEPGTRYNLIQIGDPLYDPEDNRLVGYQGLMVGEGRIDRRGDPTTMSLTDTTREVKQGDRLLPETIDIPLNFFPKAPSSVINGQIISVVGGVTQIGQYQVVVVNRGASNGLAVGDVLTVFQKGDLVRDRVAGGKVRLPDESAGTVMVFKVFDRIGFGLVMEATEALHVEDYVRNPI